MTHSLEVWRLSTLTEDSLIGMFRGLFKPTDSSPGGMVTETYRPGSQIEDIPRCPIDASHEPPAPNCDCGHYAVTDLTELVPLCIAAETGAPDGYAAFGDTLPVLLHGWLDNPVPVADSHGSRLVPIYDDGTAGRVPAGGSTALSGVFGGIGLGLPQVRQPRQLLGYGIHGNPRSTVRGGRFVPDGAFLHGGYLSSLQYRALPVQPTVLDEPLSVTLGRLTPGQRVVGRWWEQ